MRERERGGGIRSAPDRNRDRRDEWDRSGGPGGGGSSRVAPSNSSGRRSRSPIKSKLLAMAMAGLKQGKSGLSALDKGRDKRKESSREREISKRKLRMDDLDDKRNKPREQRGRTPPPIDRRNRIDQGPPPKKKNAELDKVVKKAREERSNYWDKKILEVEEKNPQRWGHSGFKELYQKDFKKPPYSPPGRRRSRSSSSPRRSNHRSPSSPPRFRSSRRSHSRSRSISHSRSRSPVIRGNKLRGTGAGTTRKFSPSDASNLKNNRVVAGKPKLGKSTTGNGSSRKNLTTSGKVTLKDSKKSISSSKTALPSSSIRGKIGKEAKDTGIKSRLGRKPLRRSTSFSSSDSSFSRSRSRSFSPLPAKKTGSSLALKAKDIRKRKHFSDSDSSSSHSSNDEDVLQLHARAKGRSPSISYSDSGSSSRSRSNSVGNLRRARHSSSSSSVSMSSSASDSDESIRTKPKPAAPPKPSVATLKKKAAPPAATVSKQQSTAAQVVKGKKVSSKPGADLGSSQGRGAPAPKKPASAPSAVKKTTAPPATPTTTTIVSKTAAVVSLAAPKTTVALVAGSKTTVVKSKAVVKSKLPQGTSGTVITKEGKGTRKPAKSASESGETESETESSSDSDSEPRMTLSERFAKLAQMSTDKREMAKPILSVNEIDTKMRVVKDFRNPESPKVYVTGQATNNEKKLPTQAPPPARPPRSPEAVDKRYSTDDRRRHFERMYRDEPAERPLDWSDARVRYNYYKERGCFDERPITIDEYVKWEDWYHKYREWLEQERYYERMSGGPGPGPPPGQGPVGPGPAPMPNNWSYGGRNGSGGDRMRPNYPQGPGGDRRLERMSSGPTPLSNRSHFGRPDGNAYLDNSLGRRIDRTPGGSLVVNIRQGGGGGGGNNFPMRGGGRRVGVIRPR